jgi:hypothetical protein
MGEKGNVATVATEKSNLRQNLEVIAWLLCPGSLIKFSIDTVREQPDMSRGDKIGYYGIIMSSIEVAKIGIEVAMVYGGYQLGRYILQHVH